MSFEGKTVFVTGASGGIGKAICLAFAKNGGTIIAGYNKNRENANKIVDEICEKGGTAISIGGDVSIRTDVKAIFKSIVKRFRKIDILVNNAGVYFYSPFMETTDDIWDLTLKINLKGVFICTQEAAKHMIPRRSGKIVNISSNSGYGAALEGDTAYAVSKAGVIQLTKNAALELGRYGINVNCVAPGAVQTKILKGNLREDDFTKLLESRKRLSSLGKIGKPEDIAKAVLFFSGTNSDFITGKTLLVDGGRQDYI